MSVHPLIMLMRRLGLVAEWAPGVSVTAQRAAHDRTTGLAHRLFPRAPRPRAVSQHSVAVEDGAILVRVYHPRGPGPHPALVYMHGGAFIVGGLEDMDPLCRFYSARAGAVVVSVDYRLAPERRYPSQLEDCYRALCWTVERADSLDVDPARVSIGGCSAGGSLAAGVAMMARDRGGPALALQLLEIPGLDCTLSQPSIQELGSGYALNRAQLDDAVRTYLGDGFPHRAGEPYASPLLATDLSELPAAVLISAEFDPLRDDAAHYAARLTEAGVAARNTVVRGQLHGTMYLTRLFRYAAGAFEDAAGAIRTASSRPSNNRSGSTRNSETPASTDTATASAWNGQT